MARLFDLRVRRGTAAAWTSANSVLNPGEIGLEADTGMFKFGDGATAWGSLGYAAIGTAAGDTRYVLASTKGAASGVATLDGSGKIPSGQIPSIRLVSVQTVASQAAMLALPGDDDAIFAVRTDTSQTFVLPAGASPATLGNWIALPQPSTAGLEQTANKDAANGYAGLDGSGKLKVADFGPIDGGTPQPMARIQQLQLRRGSAAAWATANPTLAAGELGLESDTQRLKAGDGATAWTSLPYTTAQSAAKYPVPTTAVPYLQPTGMHTPTTFTPSKFFGYCAPMLLETPMTIDTLSVNVTTAGTTGAVLRLGLVLADANNMPATLAADYGTASGTATGYQTTASNPVALAAGFYWAVLYAQGSPTTAPTIRAGSHPFSMPTSSMSYLAAATVSPTLPNQTGALSSTAGSYTPNGVGTAGAAPFIVAHRSA